MAKRTLEELVSAAREIVGRENVSDNVVTFIEDLTDSFSPPEGDGEDWQKKYEALDADWRRRYLDRFSGGGEKEGTHELDSDMPDSELEEEVVDKRDKLVKTMEKEGIL